MFLTVNLPGDKMKHRYRYKTFADTEEIDPDG